MNLSEFIRQKNIKCKDGEDFDNSPEFLKMREFERTSHVIQAVLFLHPETQQVMEFDVTLTGLVTERWDKKERKTKQRFFVQRLFRYLGLSDESGSIDDAVPAGKTVEEAAEVLEAERQRFEFFKRYDLIDAGRYWLNRDLERCLVDDGQVIVID